jgi:hypothetical protein
MRSALQAASENEKTLGEREVEIQGLKSQLSELESTKAKSIELESKITSLESEIAKVSAIARLREDD